MFHVFIFHAAYFAATASSVVDEPPNDGQDAVTVICPLVALARIIATARP
jgi:hypothetical protein